VREAVKSKAEDFIIPTFVITNDGSGRELAPHNFLAAKE
jgi:hypothetical protein